MLDQPIDLGESAAEMLADPESVVNNQVQLEIGDEVHSLKFEVAFGAGLIRWALSPEDEWGRKWVPTRGFARCFRFCATTETCWKGSGTTTTATFTALDPRFRRHQFGADHRTHAVAVDHQFRDGREIRDDLAPYVGTAEPIDLFVVGVSFRPDRRPPPAEIRRLFEIHVFLGYAR
jgi:hypothetical protein